MSTKYDKEPSDKNLSADRDFDSSLAIMEPVSDTPPKPAEWTGPRCEKCNAPMKSGMVTICRSCGWYASLGRCVDVDPDWENLDVADGGDATVAAGPQASHLRVWLNLLPRWGWIIIASIAAVVVESIVARFATPAEIGGLRTMWSFTQLLVGVLVFICCHIFNFLTLVAEDTEVGLLDVVMRPVKLWMRTCHHLPNRLWLVDSALCGLTAAVMSIVVIGALPYERLWDWGFQEPVKQNLMGAVLDRAKQLDSGNGADNLEDAIGDFAGSQDLEGGEEAVPQAPAKPLEKADCVILGYQLDREGRLETLVLGTAHRGKLIFAGRVNPEIEDAERAELLESLSSIKAQQPFIRVEGDSAVWVQPKYACRVTFGERQKGGQLRDVKWDKMLGAIRGK